jgi:hypothetical protein
MNERKKERKKKIKKKVKRSGRNGVKNRLMLKNINKTTKKNRVIVIGITVLE